MELAAAAGVRWRTARRRTLGGGAVVDIPELPRERHPARELVAESLRRRMTIELNHPQNSKRLVLGCIDDSDSESRRIFQDFYENLQIYNLLHLWNPEWKKDWKNQSEIPTKKSKNRSF